MTGTPQPSSSSDDCHLVGRHLVSACKRITNHEGLGSSLTFHRAALAYALALNLTLADEPLIVGHGLGSAAHVALGLGLGPHCSRCSPSQLERMDASHQHTVEEAIDWNDAAGGAELRDFAAGRSKPGSFGEVAARLHHEPNLVLTLRGCPRLTVPLAGGLADAVEASIRHGFELSRPLRQSAPLPWAGRPADELQVACHYRAGDVVTTFLPSGHLGELPPRIQQALSLATPPPRHAPPAYEFATARGGRLLLLSYALAALRAVAAALPASARVRCHLFAEGEASWFAPLADALPELQLHLTPLDGPPARALEDLHALASADVFVLGGGAFSELAASLGRADAVKLAPPEVWRSLPYNVPGQRLAHAPGAWARSSSRCPLFVSLLPIHRGGNAALPDWRPLRRSRGGLAATVRRASGRPLERGVVTKLFAKHRERERRGDRSIGLGKQGRCVCVTCAQI